VKTATENGPAGWDTKNDRGQLNDIASVDDQVELEVHHDSIPQVTLPSSTSLSSQVAEGTLAQSFRVLPKNPELRSPGRNERLDVLRGVAILLVLGRHGSLGDLWYRAGWIGVDIFFVLSGFLISGLIFREYRQKGYVRLGRFWLRRAFRIYPPFLAMIGATLLLGALTGYPVKNHNRIIAELTWTQNYFPPIWGQDWSLAVEEHFYLLLPLLVLLLVKLRPGDPDPFRKLPWIVLGTASVTLMLRFATSYLTHFRIVTHVEPTHLRLDSLFFGVLIAYYVQFHPAIIERLWEHRTRLLIASVLLLSTSLVWELPFLLMHTLGFTVLYMGAGGLIVFALLSERVPLRPPLRALAGVGEWSYSICLWHVCVHDYLPSVLRRMQFEGGWNRSLAYLAVSLLFGYAAHRFIEAPVLQWRDRLLPDPSRSRTCADFR
jgi:peptidoglycan/LPS O-acetylase OafA/YrhL